MNDWYMHHNNTMEIETLMNKPLWQMTGQEFCALTQYALANGQHRQESHTKFCTGIHALAEQLGCCESTIYMLRREGVLDEAIMSRIGKKIVFDIELAREAANNYQKERRAEMNSS